METVGRKLNHRFLLKSLKFLTVSKGPKLHSKVISWSINRSTLRSGSRPKEWFLNSRICNFPLSGGVRHFYVSNMHSSEKEESGEHAKEEKYGNLLKNDTELQDILKDIMLDFHDNTPPNHPPKTGKQIDQNQEKAVNSKPCETCGTTNKSMPHSIEGQFKVFDETQTEEILDIHEEEQQESFYLYQEKEDALSKYDFQRGKECVFDIEELVSVLYQENAADLVVLSVPENLHYCKYLVLVTAKSPRHLKALGEFIQKLYKKKKVESDPFIITEGKDCKDWKVLDMGEIVLHLFLEDTRKHYDLETLWTVGEQYDDLSNVKEDPVLDLLQQHIQYLDEIEPLPVAEKQ